MITFRLQDVLKDKILISRESARQVEDSLRRRLAAGAAAGSDTSEVVIDFVGVEGIAPSFLDELVSIFESLVAGGDGERRLVLANPPTRLSSKFEAIARGHGMSIRRRDDGSWIMADTGTHSEKVPQVPPPSTSAESE